MPGAYVIAWLRGEERPPHGELARHQVTVASELRCDHAERICRRCLPEWRSDYHLAVPAMARKRLGVDLEGRDVTPYPRSPIAERSHAADRYEAEVARQLAAADVPPHPRHPAGTSN